MASRSVDSERIVATATGREREEGAIDDEAATATVSNDEDGSSVSHVALWPDRRITHQARMPVEKK